MGVILLVVLLILLLGGLPQFGFHEHGWYPSGVFGVVLIVVLVLLLMGRIH